MPGFNPSDYASLSFTSLISLYQKAQTTVVNQMKSLMAQGSIQPGKFLYLQYMMSQVTQMGDSVSNLISQVQSMIMNAVRNQKSS